MGECFEISYGIITIVCGFTLDFVRSGDIGKDRGREKDENNEIE